MKVTWGIGIALTYILFVVIIIILVIFSSTKDVNLVTDDYYANELKFQDQIDKVKRTGMLTDELVLDLDDRGIHFKFPKLFLYSEIEGEILFYRPSDRKKDFIINVKLNPENILTVNKSKIEKGLWKIKIDWRADNQEYYNEKIIMVE